MRKPATIFLLLFLPFSAQAAFKVDFAKSFAGDEKAGIVAIKTDSAGNIYVLGDALAADHPTTPKFGPCGGANDFFLAKLSSDGQRLQWMTFFGGSKIDRAMEFVFLHGVIAITGSSQSPDFPTFSSIQKYPGGSDLQPFLLTVSMDGRILTFSSFLGGTNGESLIQDMVADGKGNLFLTGYTIASNWPAAVNQKDPATYDGFIAKFTFPNKSVEFTRYMGGNDVDRFGAIVLDRQENIWVAGYSNSEDFPTTNSAYQITKKKLQDIVLVKLQPDGTVLYSTFFGGNSHDFGSGNSFISVDSHDNIFVAGTTISSDFPTKMGVPKSNGPSNADGFLAEFSPAGELMFSTTIGGSSDQSMGSVGVLDDDSVALAGYTKSTDFPTTNDALQTTKQNFEDAFLRVYKNGILEYSTYYGGNGEDIPTAFEGKTRDKILLAGYSNSDDFPQQPSEPGTSFISHFSFKNSPLWKPGEIVFDPDVTVEESTGTLFVKVHREDGLDGIFETVIETADFDAAHPLAGIVYLSTRTTVMFRHGESEKFVPVQIIRDPNINLEKRQFMVRLVEMTYRATDSGSSQAGQIVFGKFMTTVNVVDQTPTPDLGPDLTIMAGEKIRLLATIDSIANDVPTEWIVSSPNVTLAELSIPNRFERDATASVPGSYTVIFNVGSEFQKTDSLVLTVLPAEGPPTDPRDPQSAVTLNQSINIFKPNNGEQASIHYTLSTTGSIHVVIYDRLGREVIDLADPVMAAGPHRLLWDGRDSSGEIVRGGTYTAYIKENEQARRLKIVVLD